ncbi:hypothetical protein U1Q18_026330 [Sarracenia purpurea var. burkii]
MSSTMVLGNLTSQLDRIWSASTVGFYCSAPQPTLSADKAMVKLGDLDLNDRHNRFSLSSDTYRVQLDNMDLSELDFKGDLRDVMRPFWGQPIKECKNQASPTKMCSELGLSCCFWGLFCEVKFLGSLRNSHSSSSFKNSSNSIPGAGPSNRGHVFRDASNMVLNSGASS